MLGVALTHTLSCLQRVRLMGRTATGCFPLGPVWICELGSDADMGLSQFVLCGFFLFCFFIGIKSDVV